LHKTLREFERPITSRVLGWKKLVTLMNTPFLIGVSASLCACGGDAAIAYSPDLRPLQESYDRPTAVLDAPAAGESLRLMPSIRLLALGFRAAGYATRGADDAGETASPSDDGLRVQGTVLVTLRCPGQFREPVFDESTNGTFSLAIGIENSRIRRGISASATNCVLRGSADGLPVPVEVDGPVEFDFGRDLALKERFTGQLLMQLSGAIDINGSRFEGLSARWTSDHFEYLFELPDGTTVVAELSDQGVGVRDRDATYTCPDELTCALD